MANGEEYFSVGAEDLIEHSEEVVTSNLDDAVQQPREVIMEQPSFVQQSVYSIPTVITSPGPIMQVVTLQSVQPTPQTALTNTLRNIRLIAIQPRLPFNGTRIIGSTNQLPVANLPKQEIPIQPKQVETVKLSVGNFYSKVPAKSQPVRDIKPITPIIKSGPNYWKEQQLLQKEAEEQKLLKEYPHLNEELQKGLRIFLDLTSKPHNKTIWPFLDQVDPVKDGAIDYYKVIDKPMWLNKIKDKFKQGSYQTIADFVMDFRLMLENCYRYNGPNHPITKKALRLEQLLEQKLALLPSDLCEKCSLEKGFGSEILDVDPEITKAKLRKQSFGVEPYFSYLLHRVRDERQKREKEAEERLLEIQRQKKEEREKRMCQWAEQIMNQQIKNEMRLMWEIPQIGHFLYLARKALHIGEIAQYELEHMFLMPEASALLATLMTSLLSSPNQRVKLAEAPPTPYSTWAGRLNSRVAEWYRTYNREGRNLVKVHELLGLEPMFWNVCGIRNPLEGKLYHQLSFLKRIWIFKGLCDTVIHGHKTVQEAMAEEEGVESREITLGQDRDGYTYFYFPAVSGSDIRVYRQRSWELAKDPIWGPICAQRREEEEQKAREEEEKQGNKRKKASAMAASRKTAFRKPAPVKRKGGRAIANSAISAATTTPSPRKRKKATTERPLRIGTRISPRTLQRQTGLANYKESSSDEENQSESDDDSIASSPEEEIEDETEEDEEEEPKPEEKKVRKPARRKRTGWNPRKRRPAKKKLPMVKEEEEDEAIEEPEEEEDVTEQEEAELKKEDTVTIKKEQIQDIPVKEEKEEQKLSNSHEHSVKLESEENVPKQRFTVSQLLEKFAAKDTNSTASEDIKEELESEEKVVPKVEEESTVEPESEPDPDRASYDPFYFELIITTVEELKKWIAVFSDPEDDEEAEEHKESKPRPRCEVKLRDRLKALLEEAEPLAADQLQANEKICRHLWKQWDQYYNKNYEAQDHSDSEHNPATDHDGSEDYKDSDESDDGLRHSKRLRKRRFQETVNSEQSTRSSSPLDEAPAKVLRKGSYGFDPAWDAESEKSPTKKPIVTEHMKDPHYWIGRRITRATAQYASSLGMEDDASYDNPSEVSADESKLNEENSREADFSPIRDHSEKPLEQRIKSEQLISQLRQLRRQQAMLTSNDPKPSVSTNGTSVILKDQTDKAVNNLQTTETVQHCASVQGRSIPIQITNTEISPSKDNSSGQFKQTPGTVFTKVITTGSSKPQVQRLILSPGSTINRNQAVPAKSTTPVVWKLAANHPVVQQQESVNSFHSSESAPCSKAQTEPKAVRIDITSAINQAAKQGLIVSHEPRSLLVKVEEYGFLEVSSQMTPSGPKIHSVVPCSAESLKKSNGILPELTSSLPALNGQEIGVGKGSAGSSVQHHGT